MDILPAGEGPKFTKPHAVPGFPPTALGLLDVASASQVEWIHASVLGAAVSIYRDKPQFLLRFYATVIPGQLADLFCCSEGLRKQRYSPLLRTFCPKGLRELAEAWASFNYCGIGEQHIFFLQERKYLREDGLQFSKGQGAR